MAYCGCVVRSVWLTFTAQRTGFASALQCRQTLYVPSQIVGNRMQFVACFDESCCGPAHPVVVPAEAASPIGLDVLCLIQGMSCVQMAAHF